MILHVISHVVLWSYMSWKDKIARNLELQLEVLHYNSQLPLRDPQVPEWLKPGGLHQQWNKKLPRTTFFPPHISDPLHPAPINDKTEAKEPTHNVWLVLHLSGWETCVLAVAKQSNFCLQLSIGHLGRLWEERIKRSDWKWEDRQGTTLG